MKMLDYIYEEILCPAWENVSEFILQMLDCMFTALVFITIPLWIVPYLIVRKRRGGE